MASAWRVFSLLGRVFMRPVDCPWTAADRVLAQLPADVKVIVVDFHAEATSDMQLMGRYLDGRVSAVLGTHTHVPTADEQILPGGTAFQCDVGMTGPHDSILGRRVDRVLEATLTFNPTHFDVAMATCESTARWSTSTRRPAGPRPFAGCASGRPKRSPWLLSGPRVRRPGKRAGA